MYEKKKTEITIETRRRLVIGQSRRTIACAWCEACDANRDMLTVECTTLVSGLTHREIFKHVESGGLHFTESGDRPLICLASLCELMTPQKS